MARWLTLIEAAQHDSIGCAVCNLPPYWFSTNSRVNTSLIFGMYFTLRWKKILPCLQGVLIFKRFHTKNWASELIVVHLSSSLLFWYICGNILLLSLIFRPPCFSRQTYCQRWPSAAVAWFSKSRTRAIAANIVLLVKMFQAEWEEQKLKQCIL